MKSLLIPALLISAASLWVGNLGAHGGTYRGPGDTVPPGAGGGGGNGNPGTGGPSNPGQGGGTGTGGTPTGTPGAPPRAPGGTQNAPRTGGEAPADLEYWSFWWEFNKDPFLNLKEAIYSNQTTTGGDGFFLGEGSTEAAKDQHRPDEGLIQNSIVPALLAALEKERSNDIVTGCLIALAKIGDTAGEGVELSPFAKLIAEFLRDPSQEIRETAAIALGILAHPSSLPLLDGLLNDTKIGQDAVGSTVVDIRTRAFAAYGLGLMAGRSTSEELQQKIAKRIVDSMPGAARQATPDISVALVTSLGLTQLPVSGNESTKEAPQAAWNSVEGALDYLIQGFQDENLNFLLRAHFPVAMGRLLQSPELAGAASFEAMKHKVVETLLLPLDARKGNRWPEELEQSAAFALGLVGDCDNDKLDVEIRKTLIRLTTEGQNQAKRFAMIALAKTAGRPGTPGEEQFSAVKEVEKHLIGRLKDGKGGDRHWAGLALGVLGNTLRDASIDLKVAPGKLAEAFEQAKSVDDIGAFAVSLGVIGNQDAQGELLERLKKTSEWTAQGYVALGLGLMRASEAKAKIQEVVRGAEFKPELLKQAAIALGLLGDKNVVSDLTEMLKTANSLSAQAAIASALGFIGDTGSVEPLVQMLQDESLTDGARGFAAVALGIVADKEILPWNSKIAVDVNYRASTQTLNTTDGKGVLNIL